MQFHVVAIQADGNAAALMIEAADASAARRSAMARGLTVLELTPASLRARWGGERAAAPRERFDVDLFAQELLALVTAGITIGEALETLSRKQADPVGARVIGVLLERVREGLALSAAMQQQPVVFPLLLTQSLRAAERTSDYGPALTRFVRYRRLAADMRSKVLTAALYPMILLGVSGLVLLFLVGYVVPRFAQVYEDIGDRLPGASRALLALGRWIDTEPVLAIAFAAAAIVLLVLAGRTGLLRRLWIAAAARIPRLRSALLAIDLARLYRTLALLLHGGIPLVSALELARGLLAPSLQPRLDRARSAIGEGRSFSASMAEHGLVTVVAERFFTVGEQTGRLAEMVDRAAEFHEEEIHRAADWLGRVVGPVMMLLIGGVIGLVVVLMYLPIFQLSEALQ